MLLQLLSAQQMDRPAKMDPEQRKKPKCKKQQEHLDKMSKDLNLSQDQVKKSKIYKINKWQICKKYGKERWKEKLENGRNEEKQDAHAAEMKKNLDARTIPKWDADKKAKMEKEEKMMKDRKGEFREKKNDEKNQDAPVVE